MPGTLLLLVTPKQPTSRLIAIDSNFCIFRNFFEPVMEKLYLNLSNPNLKLKFKLIIRNLYTLYTCNIEKNFAEKITTRDTV